MFYYINNILVDISMEFLAVLIYSYLRTSKNLKQIVHIIKVFFSNLGDFGARNESLIIIFKKLRYFIDNFFIVLIYYIKGNKI